MANDDLLYHDHSFALHAWIQITDEEGSIDEEHTLHFTSGYKYKDRIYQALLDAGFALRWAAPGVPRADEDE